MKRISFIIVLAAAMAGCTPKGVDIDIDDGRYTLNISSIPSFPDLPSCNGYMQRDSLVYCTTIPDLACTLTHFTRSGIDAFDTTMYYIDKVKQAFLPRYEIFISNREPERPHDFNPLLQLLIDRGLLVADTTYEPLRLLVVADTVRYHARLAGLQDSDTLDCMCAFNIVDNLRTSYRMPVATPDSLSYYLRVEYRRLADDREGDSLWLVDHGFRLVPDPQGRQMRIITFNRHKGKV